MSIELRNVTVRTRNTLSPITLSNLNLQIGARDRFAFLGPPKSGVELVVSVICGAMAPDEGRVIRTSSLSWPLPSAPFLHKHLTFVANARFVARIYEADERPFINRVLEMADLQEMAEERVDHCPSSAVSRFTFALGACLPFDIYLVIKTKVGDKSDHEKFAGVLTDLGKRSGLILATSSTKDVAEYCDSALVLDPVGPVYYDDIEAATEHLQRIIKRREETDEMEFPEDESGGQFDDF
ncbi:MAG: hypothetical protein JO208_09550 [Alphaproteobacteria bacterium]|nr:hypothetical protein [Alphaproteobacteria bacterium]